MGIHDRDYYRHDKRGFLDSFAGTGHICKWLVTINVIVYAIQLLTIDRTPPHGGHGFFTDLLIMKPDKVFFEGHIWRLLTGAFLHSTDAWQHIVWNMLFLWFFGPDIEDIYGHREFLLFYLAAGVLGNVLWGVTSLWQELPINALGETIYPMALGASGAVMAVIVLCALHFPHRTILIMFILPVPMWLWATILVAADLFHFLGPNMNTGVAVAAHVGGAGFAFLYKHFDWRISNLGPAFKTFRRRASRKHLRIYEEAPVAVAGSLDEQLEAKADAILAKVHQRGISSLSDEEREILRKASELAKKRRT